MANVDEFMQLFEEPHKLALQTQESIDGIDELYNFTINQTAIKRDYIALHI